MNTHDYLHLILIPVAEVFRAKFPEGKAPFFAISNAKQCRVKFASKRLDKEWSAFCKTHDLKNEASLEY